MKNPTKIMAAGILAAGLTLTACAPTAQTGAGSEDGAAEAPESVDVGIVYSKTGPLAAYGEEYYAGLQAGIDYATDGTGTVGETKINLTYHDDGGDPDKGVSIAKELIGKEYKILAGTTVSGIALKLAEQAEQNQILYISGPAATDAVTGINDYTFRSGRQSIQDVATAGQFVDDLKGSKVLVFGQDNAFGQGNVAAVEGVLGAEGAEVSDILVPEDVTEFTPFARQIVDAKPDLVFVAWAGANAGSMWQALEQQGAFEAAPIVTGLANKATYGAYGAAGEKISFLSHYFPGAGQNEVEDFMMEHVEEQGAEPDLFTPDGFVAGQMIVQAIEEGGGTDVDSMVTALEGWEFGGPKGTTTVRADDHALVQDMYQAKLVQKGSEWTPELVETVGAADAAPPTAAK
ncbi:substrate-binding domain-containing protein [Citricoccus sp.]|nr:substrate-binding domain-containing protein [Citricoccus sp.]MBB5748313.1 branched-chain amino acid transport system substrate-binding protein [Micrococcus sp. TA1]HRO29469.1 substrate-binding domain-containing protein [Citricoccus sp.]HRO94669.1 substrate-binding domain-containing protein [Citricoccus sp.]